MMTEPNGQDTLRIREAYLHRRAADRQGNRAATAVWLAIGTGLSWLFFTGLIGMAH